MAESSDKMIELVCNLCKKKARFQVGADGKVKFDELLEHVRIDVGYRPYYCGHTTCVGSWPSERQINNHHQMIHKDDERLVFNQRQSILDHHCERLLNIVFPTVSGSTSKKPPEQLADYVKTDAATRFIEDLRKWRSHVHLEFILKSVTPEEDEPVVHQPPIKKVKLELIHYVPPDGSKEPLLIELDDDDDVDADPMENTQQSGQSSATSKDNESNVRRTTTEQPQRSDQVATSSQQIGAKKHVYAKFVKAVAPADQFKKPMEELKDNMPIPETSNSTAPKQSSDDHRRITPMKRRVVKRASGSGHGGSVSTKPKLRSRGKQTWASFNKRWHVRNVAAPASASSSATAQASEVPTVASILMTAVSLKPILTKDKDGRYRRACAVCGKRILVSSQPKHIDSHLNKKGEFRYECLLCLKEPNRPKKKCLRTMFDDTTKIRHIPNVHGIPKPVEGVHFRDYTVENGLVAKRRLMHQRCFPRVLKGVTKSPTGKWMSSASARPSKK